MPLARPSRSVVCACAISCSTVCVACAPVSLPFIFIASSTLSHGPAAGPPAWLALATAAKNMSSIFSMLASASFSGFSLQPGAAARRTARAPCGSPRPPAAAPSRCRRAPCRACPRRRPRPPGCCAAPVEVASATVLTTLRMLSSVSSRPCSACKVASPTALRSASPCLALASREHRDQRVLVDSRLDHGELLVVRAALARARHCMCWPPLMAMFAPVTKAASSEAR